MIGDYIKKNFVTIFATPPIPEDERRSGYNGTILQVDMSSPADHVDEKNMIILDSRGKGLDLTQSIAYAIWMHGGKDTGLAQVNEATIAASANRVSHLACLWTFYRLFSTTTLPMGVRSSDTTSLPFPKQVLWNEDKFSASLAADEAKAEDDAGDEEETGDDSPGGGDEGAPAAARDLGAPEKRGWPGYSATGFSRDHFDAYGDGKFIEDDVAGEDPPAGCKRVDHPVWRAAKQLEAYFFNDGNKTAQEHIAVNGKMILHAFYGVALHRKLVDGHSWVTSMTKMNDKPTYRCGAVAGAAQEEFRTFMKEHGHDIIHHLPNDVLDNICYALDPASPDDKQRTITADITYMGEQVNGRKLWEVLKVSEAATDRWPVGTLGKAALVLGCHAITAMLRAIMQRIYVQNGSIAVQAVATLLKIITNPDTSKEVVNNARTTMVRPIVFAVGFNSVSSSSSEPMAESINAVVKANDDEFQAGKKLGEAVASAPVHKGALATAIAAQFDSIVKSIASLDGVPDDVKPAGEAGDVEIGETDAAIAHARMIETLDKVRG